MVHSAFVLLFLSSTLARMAQTAVDLIFYLMARLTPCNDDSSDASSFPSLHHRHNDSSSDDESTPPLTRRNDSSSDDESSPGPPTLLIGDTVKIIGLVNKTKLNGCVGKVAKPENVMS